MAVAARGRVGWAGCGSSTRVVDEGRGAGRARRRGGRGARRASPRARAGAHARTSARRVPRRPGRRCPLRRHACRRHARQPRFARRGPRRARWADAFLQRLREIGRVRHAEHGLRPGRLDRGHRLRPRRQERRRRRHLDRQPGDHAQGEGRRYVPDRVDEDVRDDPARPLPRRPQRRRHTRRRDGRAGGQVGERHAGRRRLFDRGSRLVRGDDRGRDRGRRRRRRRPSRLGRGQPRRDACRSASTSGPAWARWIRVQRADGTRTARSSARRLRSRR